MKSMPETQLNLFSADPLEIERDRWFTYRDGCQYAPERQGVAYTVEVHAGAEFIVFLRDDRFWPWTELRLCGQCAARPEFEELQVERI